MGEQSAARLKGDDYQHLYSWLELTSLLNPISQYEYGYVEHPSAGAADDVTLHSKHPGLATKFTQIKFHVDQKSQYSSSSLIEILKPARSSLLQKLFDSWRNLRNGGNQNVEIWLVSNWAYAQDLGRFVSDAGILTEDFFIGGDRSRSGRIRIQWRHALGATSDEMDQFCRTLRLRLGFGGLNEIEERVDERMERYNLRAGLTSRAIILDIVRGWIKQGGDAKRINREVLERTIRERGLKTVPVDQPSVSLLIHGWAKRGYDLSPTIELDWTRYFNFDTRTVPSQQTWEQDLFPELKAARNRIAAIPEGMYVDFRAKVPLTASLAVGRVFSEPLGFRFRVEQPSGGDILLWRSDVRPSHFSLDVKEQMLSSTGSAGIMSVSITGDSRSDVEKSIIAQRSDFKIWQDISPVIGPGSIAVKSDSEAVSIAEQLKALIRNMRTKYRVESVHLALYCPATIALFFGQRLNAVGEVVSYERTITNTYRESLRLQTG